MKNFENKMKTAVLELNEKKELKQNVRNAFKSELMTAFNDFLKANGFDTEMVIGGVAVQFQNDEIGSVCVVFDGTIKSKDYDIVSENESYVQKVSEKIAKEQKAYDEKQLKIAQQLAEKELKAKAKETK